MQSSISSSSRRVLGSDSKSLTAGTRRQDPRLDELHQQRRQHDQLARAAAERGDTTTAARAILAMLACERRLASAGPQVLQVIKPRT